MDPIYIGIAGIVLVLVLMSQRLPVAFAMMVVGITGHGILDGWTSAFSTFVTETWSTTTYYELVVIPMFVMMGNVASISGMSRDLYNAAYAWVGQFRGGLAHATVIGCTGFAALSGSSVASALTLGRVAMPEMARFGYDSRLAAGAVAAGGTLGILIPPSTGFVIYAILTEESVGRLFLAGVFPGLLLASLFLVVIFVQTSIRPELGPPARTFEWRERIESLGRGVSIIVIIVVSIGGIYAGVFTPVEAAAVGAVLAMIISALRRKLNLRLLSKALVRSVATTVMIYFIIIGANVFSPFLAHTGIPDALAEVLVELNLGPVAFLAIVLTTFIFLGTFLDGFAAMVLVLPIVLPLIEQSNVPDMLGFAADSSDLRIWFGVIMVIIIEMALISPPVGMNVFVVKGVARNISMREIYIGILPFWGAMILALLVLILFPQICLFLPNSMIQ
ncbi:MAG: TRAP transporter large permease [Arenicellales bacterium]|jgi:tripartite ATP-independent transporter DctM subunit|nr:TRAP transporter large permease [Arenicellales bacterium]MDP6267579.1 TRAP transporter large permease [Arenicellales bacterium]MDP6392265.1 TRAP transporter large permease [Arenicellales bacterium]MDP7523578.1 TRAP transporter large permease [Arenicellales bacterium]|tara:strand:+ start:2083 stop:3423 length:1341 start_codon:yes stop_codon:yes gene_type:complete